VKDKDEKKERTVKIPVIEISGDRIKGGNALVVPLSRPAAEIIRRLPRIEGSAFVFPSAKNGDGTADRPASGYGKSKILMDALMLAELKKGDVSTTLTPWRVHDLRRTCRSGLSRLHIESDIAELAIGHALTGVRKIYDRYDYLYERHEALEQWGDFVVELVTPPPPAQADNVLPFQKAG
jgi:integrase